MAEPIVQKFIIDTEESEQNLKSLDAQVQNTSASINQVADAENNVAASSKSLKAQLRELQAELARTEPNSAKYRELALAAGDLKDKIQDAAQAVGTQAGGAFERVGGSLGLVTSRLMSLDFAGAGEGAKLLAKNISDIKPADIAKGVQGIGSAFASVGKALLTNPIFLIGAAIAAAIIYSKELLTLVDGVSGAEQERLATQQKAAQASKEQLDSISAQENILKLAGKSEREILDLKIKAAQQAIIDQEAVITTLEIQRQQQIDASERNAKILSGIIQFISAPLQLLLGAVDGIIFGLNKVGVISDETYKNIGSLRDKMNQSITSLVFDPKKVAEDGQKTIDEAKKVLVNLKNQQAGLQLQVKALDDKKAADKKAANEKALAEQKAQQDKEVKALEDYYTKLAALDDQRYQESLSKSEQEELAIVQKYEALFAAADAAGKDTVALQQQLNAELAALDAQRTANAKAESDRRKGLEDDFFNQYKNLQADFIAEEDQRYYNSLSNSEQEELRVTQKYEKLFDAADKAGKDTTKLQKELAEKLLKIQQKSAQDSANAIGESAQTAAERVDAALNWAAKGLNAISGLTDAVFANRMAKVKKGSKEEEELAKKQFKFNKAMQLSGAVIDAAKAINASLAAAPVAIGFVPNPVGIASLALAAASGAASIGKIAATRFEGGSATPPSTTTPSLGGGGGGESTPAQFNPLAGMNIGTRPEQLTPKAYVLAGDVASQQEVRQKVTDLSRIG